MKVVLKNLILIPLIALLAACGSGGGSLSRDDNGGNNGGGGSTPDVTYTISLSIVDTVTGEVSNQLSTDTPLTVNATVTSSDGSSTEGKVVSFSFDDDSLATFGVENGRVAVGSNGVASIDLVVGDKSGAGYVIASIDTYSVQLGFNSVGTTQQTTQPVYLDLYASTLQLASSGKDKIELTALVKNANNVVMKDVEVSFSVSNDATLTDVQSLTSEYGIARAMLSTTNKPENRTVTVKVATGGTTNLSKTIDIDIIGTEIQIGGASSVILGDTAPLTIKIVDSDGVGIKNQPVTLSAQLGELSNLTPITHNDGSVEVEYKATTAGEDVITATALNATGRFDMDVQEDDFTFTTSPTADVPLGTPTTLTVTWKKGNVAYAGGTVTFKSSRGDVSVPQSVVTNAMGQASVTVQADNAGVTSISADGVDADGNAVSARTQFEFVAVNAASIIVDATPDSIGPNEQTSTITAVVRDANDNLVKGKFVDFKVEDVSGGTITNTSVLTDSNGLASTVFTSNAVSSNELIRVYATVSDTPAVTDFTTLTVADRPFDISIGTGRLIESADSSSYLKEFAVFVSDSDGNPAPNVNLTVSMGPVKYNQGGVFRKGYWVWDDDNDIWVIVVTATCDNEDVDDNGILDSGEDTNGDTFLTPGIVGTAQLKGGITNTDENGQATMEIRYPKAFGAWTDVSVKALAQSSGSESAQSQKYTLSVAASDLTDDASPPPSSPFGIGTSCTDTN
ncbi:Ig-like domain-containing protein [Neptunicella sp.]|uniref:Ig-like domain-containing protein n=1 Tax=Neptunicella sp. TaxID=2125986 RepID=UPI003F68C9CC